MNAADLDNPIWAALRSRHAASARGSSLALRYPSAMAPFAAVPSADSDADAALDTLIDGDETVYFLGCSPRVSQAWSLHAYAPLAQMICPEPLAPIDGPEAIELSDVHRADVMDLTALVYPHYFRADTMAMGRYFGIYENGRLAAMIGERMGTDRCQEISAICTHPDFNGRGYARRLLAMLTNATLERGRLPFLHVSHENVRAKGLYEQIGYRHRGDIGFWSLRRAQHRGGEQ